VPQLEEYERQFLLERYKADRAHELEVEKFSAQFEIAFIQSSVLLNGAFAAGVLAFYGATIDKVILSKKLLLGSFVCWLIGLSLGIIAGGIAYYAQQNIVSLLRNRRHERGIHSLGEEYPHLLGSPRQHPIEKITDMIREQECKGKIGIWLAWLFGGLSLLAAITRAFFALAALWYSSRIVRA
jgi:hypothetical protein